jgi:hypothetical protein
MGVPTGNKGGSCKPTAKSEISCREKEKARPTDKNKPITAKPVIDSIEPPPSVLLSKS